MLENNCEAVLAGNSESRDGLRPSAEVLESGQDGDTITYTPAGRRLLRVLVADDDRDTADSLAMLVKIWGHEVRQAYDGATVLAMASDYRPDVLLLDIAMPKMDGCRLARQLRRQSRLKDTLLIAITGYADKAQRLLCEEAGFDHFLIKPAEPSTVENLLLLQSDRLAEPREVPRASPRTYGILVVDDEEGVRGVLNAGLRQDGYAVWLAANGQEALEMYRRHRATIDVVLLDVRMPVLDGPQTLSALQKTNPRIRCCFMSGDLGGYTEERLCDSGADAVIRKPFRLDEVAQKLRELVSNADLTTTTL